jgi:hypothetical protein
MLALLAVGCNDGIDPISRVEPGPDETAPAVTIGYPDKAKIVIPFTQDKTDLDIKLDVTDDIEIKSININLDNADVITFNSFPDYRRSVKSYVYSSLPVGHHTLKITATDLSDKVTTKTIDFEVSNVYEPKYAGEILYMPFEGGVYTDLISKTNPTIVGAPTFADGKTGKAYAGANGAYLSLPVARFADYEEFSAALWCKLNVVPDRAGILAVSAPDLAAPDAPNNHAKGFRLFREANGSNQIFKLNCSADTWVDAASTLVDPGKGWVHLAFTITPTKGVFYINGAVAKESTIAGVDWTDCTNLSIASGAPLFTGWGHLSDASLYDEIRFFNKALTIDEVKAVMEDK